MYVGETEGNVGIKNWQVRSHIVYIGHNPHAWEWLGNDFVGFPQCVFLI